MVKKNITSYLIHGTRMSIESSNKKDRENFCSQMIVIPQRQKITEKGYNQIDFSFLIRKMVFTYGNRRKEESPKFSSYV